MFRQPPKVSRNLFAALALFVLALVAFPNAASAQTGSNYFAVEVDATCACDFQITAWGWGAPNAPVTVNYSFTATVNSVDYPVTGVLTTTSDANGYFWVQSNGNPLPGGCQNSVSFSNGNATRTVGTKTDSVDIDLQAPPPGGCGLTVIKSPKNGTFAMGTQVSFTILVTNKSVTTDTNVLLHDQLPTNGGLTWASAVPSKGSCTISGTGVLDCSFGDLAGGASATVVVSSTVTTPDSACQF